MPGSNYYHTTTALNNWRFLNWNGCCV